MTRLVLAIGFLFLGPGVDRRDLTIVDQRWFDLIPLIRSVSIIL